MRGRILLSLLALGALACQAPLSAEPEWVRWFSYRWIGDLAVAPDGEITVVGRSMGDELTAGSSEQTTWRPFVARLDADGEVLDDWIGYDGHADDVAIDDQGRAYVVLDGLAPSRHPELWALDHDGSVRWSRSWDAGLWPQVVVVGDAVIVRVDRAIEAFELDGRPRWQAEVAGHYDLVQAEDGVWVLDQISTTLLVPTLETHAWRFDARDGARSEVLLELPQQRSLGTATATPNGFLVTSQGPGPSPGVYLSSLSFQGRLRWEREVSPEHDPDALPDWVPALARVIADGPDPWIIGTQSSSEGVGDTDEARRNRMWLQRWSAEGSHEGTLYYAFEDPGVPDDPEPAVLARAQCVPTPSGRYVRFGSTTSDAVALPDGTLLVPGQQGCRDAFLLRLSVEP